MSKKSEITPNVQEAATQTAAAEAKSKATPVEERKYALVEDTAKSFKGKQRQIVFDILLASKREMTIAEVAKEAAEKGLHAIGGVEPSCRYHLHHLTKDGVTKLVNPTLPTE